MDNKIETVTSHILTPYPGTKLYKKFKTTGRLISDDYEIDNEFPRLLWFNKGKLIENDFVIRNDDFSDFKNNIKN